MVVVAAVVTDLVYIIHVELIITVYSQYFIMKIFKSVDKLKELYSGYP